MSYEFDADTAVRREADGAYAATLAQRWGVPGGPPNGGYVMALAARAMAEHLDRPHPASLTCHFVAPASPGEATIEVETVRPGGRHATGAASVRQGDREVARLLGTFTDLDRASGPTLVTAGPPDLPPVEQCKASPPSEQTILGRFDYRMPAEDLAWRTGQPKGEGRVRGYLAFHDGRPIDPLALVTIVDAFAPAAFDLGLPPSWVPTIELT
ncbi:MAG TPA: thioesterase family protein, partial [Nitriliruptorales bacterium]